MADRAPASPARFKEASDWFRTRLPVTRDEWDGMRVAARRQSFTIAGAQQLDVVQAVMESLQSAIDKGTPIDKWREDVRESLSKKFGTAGDIKPSTLTTAFINANQHAYNAGRFEQMNSPDVQKALPYWKFDAVLDDRTTKNVCRPCAGTILPHDHPWWQTHFPPLHHRCRSTVRALSERMAKRQGGVSNDVPRPGISGDFGLAPNVSSDWAPDLNKYEPNAAREYTRKQQSMQERALKRERRRFRRATPELPSDPPSTRLGEVGEKVFGRKITDSELDSLAGAKAQLPPGFTFTVSNVEENAKRGHVSVVGAIKNSKGEVVGNVSRKFRLDAQGNTVAEHASFLVSNDYQSHGLGRALFNAQIDAYEATGLVKNVELDAATAGRYVWTKAGFEWSDADKETLFGHLRTRLVTKVDAVAVERILAEIATPYDAARLVVDGERIGKDLLMDYPEDIITMSQTPANIKRL